VKKSKADPFPAETIRVTPGLADHDCAIVALSWYLGVCYADVLREAAFEDPAKAKRGLSTLAMMRTAYKLGCTLRRRKRVDLHEDYGILILANHAAVIRNGLLFEPDGVVWDIDVYMANKHGLIKKEIECLLVTAPSRKAVVR
jgi:hypothetical protein